LVDPSGSNYDDYLWWVYYNSIQANLEASDGDIIGLGATNDWTDLADIWIWMAKGVSFEGEWTIGEVENVIEGLEMIDAAVGGNAEYWLGLDRGLIISRSGDLFGGNYDAYEGKITLGHTTTCNDGNCTVNTRDILYVFIHEAGHRIMDVTMGLDDGSSWWTERVTGWGIGNRFTGDAKNDLFTKYGREEPSEDFAEMFVWFVLTTNQETIPSTITYYATNDKPSKDRQNAIKAFFNLHNHPRSVHGGY
jgi:hypothetical protein